MDGGAATIVIVDDDPDVRLLIKTHLRMSGRLRIVAEASDGEEAVARAREHEPSLMLLDVAMPRMDGLDALPLVLDASPRTQVILYSGFDEHDLATRARELGATAYIDKSFPIEALADRLLALLGARATRADAGPLDAPAPGSVADPDVAPGHTATEPLRHSEEHFRLLVEAVTDYAIFMLDPDGNVATWNAGAQRIKGYTADEIVGRHFRVFYPPEAQQVHHPEHELGLALRDGSYGEEGWRVRKDGSTFWASVVITAVFDGSGRHVGFAKVTRDMSDRRRLEEDRERALDDLATANADLESLNGRLRQAAQDQARFLAVTAHELRSPVAVLGGAADTLRRHPSALTEQDRSDIFDAMGSSAARVRRLLDDLLTASRLQASALTLQREPVLVAEVLGRATTTVASAWPDAVLEVAPSPAVVLDADPDRITQAVENLLTNALRHGASPVRLDTRPGAGAVDICVRDSGAGVEAEMRPRLFQRFATGRRGGTGLGLYIVRELALAHGGDAFYEPAPDDGAGTFVLRLPCAPVPGAAG